MPGFRLRTPFSVVILASVLSMTAQAAAPVAPSPPARESVVHPPIPIRFNLPVAGYVTLVIEDQQGQRVRNLVAETLFPAGADTAWWDGLDDLGRDPEAANHAVDYIPGRLVQPGTYRVRGLYRQAIDLRYAMTVYNPGEPPWTSASPTSNWLANHTPPQSVLFVPEAETAPTPAGHTAGGLLLIGSYVTEGGSSLAFLDAAGHKRAGLSALGGAWTGAPFLARDAGPRRVPGIYAYAGSAWEKELRLTALGRDKQAPVLTPNFPLPPPGKVAETDLALAGLAVHNGLLVASLGLADELLLVDATAGRVLGTVPLEKPRGLAFDQEGRLNALAGSRLLRFPVFEKDARPSNPTVLADGLDEPFGLTVGEAGNLYVSERGHSHRVKVISPVGRVLQSIGKAGLPATGPYDPNHMNNPAGLAVDATGRLWVAEMDLAPKRVSVWQPNGTLDRAFYGPARYGGGGELDPVDPDLFYYEGMRFRLDWDHGTSVPDDVFCRADPALPPPPAPQTPLHVGQRLYLTDAYSRSPTNGAPFAVLWLMENGVARPVAAMGQANRWPVDDPTKSWFATNAFKPRMPAGLNPGEPTAKNPVFFVWSDTNGDGRIEPDEVTFYPGLVHGVRVGRDLAFVVTLEGRAVRCPPVATDARGVPGYDFSAAETLVAGAQATGTTGGGQTLAAAGGWTVLTAAPRPFTGDSIGGALNGVPRWSYPSLWPGLHASHHSPLPDHPGELIGTTRLLGDTITPHGSDAGEIFAVNGNKGTVYLLTTDGLFVATLFRDSRTAFWNMPVARPGMSLNDISLGEEDFWPTITQVADGRIFLQAGFQSSLVEVQGLEAIRRLPAFDVTVTGKDLLAAESTRLAQETARHLAHGPETRPLVLAANPPAPVMTAPLWAAADWAPIETRFEQVGDWSHVDFTVQAALVVAGLRLYAAYHTDDPDLLRNAGGALPLLFKTGGALDLQMEGDDGPVRLLVTRVNNKSTAVLYQPKAAHPSGPPVEFGSPLRTLAFDRVEDVSTQVELTEDHKGNYWFSVPLATLGLRQLDAGRTIRGDVGLLRGNGFQTLQRVYWSNKETGLVSDIPSEAELLPALWGRWSITPAPPAGPKM